MKDKLAGIIENTFHNSLFNIMDIIEYSPPLYDPSWNKKFKKYDPSTRVPDKNKSKFVFNFKEKNPLNLNNNKLGVYLILGTAINFAYIGCSDKKLNQRFTTHIQKITATNLGRWYTPINWDAFIIKRYEKLREKSVLLDDIKLTFFDYTDFEKILDNENDPKTELEAIIFFYFKSKLGTNTLINAEKQVSNKFYRDKYKNLW